MSKLAVLFLFLVTRKLILEVNDKIVHSITIIVCENSVFRL